MAKIDKFNVASFMPILRCTLSYKLADLSQWNITIHGKLHYFRNFYHSQHCRDSSTFMQKFNEYIITLQFYEQINLFSWNKFFMFKLNPFRIRDMIIYLKDNLFKIIGKYLIIFLSFSWSNENSIAFCWKVARIQKVFAKLFIAVVNSFWYPFFCSWNRSKCVWMTRFHAFSFPCKNSVKIPTIVRFIQTHQWSSKVTLEYKKFQMIYRIEMIIV